LPDLRDRRRLNAAQPRLKAANDRMWQTQVMCESCHRPAARNERQLHAAGMPAELSIQVAIL